jgi:hypothetical protein
LYFFPLPQGHGSFRLVLLIISPLLYQRRRIARYSVGVARPPSQPVTVITTPEGHSSPVCDLRPSTSAAEGVRGRRGFAAAPDLSRDKCRAKHQIAPVNARTFPRYRSSTNLCFRESVPDCHGSGVSKDPG